MDKKIISMKLNNYFLYFMVLVYIVSTIFNIPIKELILLIIFMYIFINISYLKPLITIGNKKENEVFPLVSIIIPAWNEEDIINETIKNVLKSTYPDFELIIIAGGDDKTYELANFYPEKDNRIKVIKQEPHGKSAALNKGLKYVQGEIVVFLDADSQVDENWLKYLVRPIISGESNITVANFKPYEENWVSMWYSLYFSYLRNVENKKSFFGGSRAFDRAVFDDTSALDERVIADDYYLGVRLGKKYKIKFVEESIVRTDIPGTLTKFLITETRWVRSLLHTTFISGDRKIKTIFSLLNVIYFISGLPVWLYLYYVSGKESSFMFLNVWFSYFSLLILLNLVKPLSLFRITGDSKWLKYAWIVLVFPVIEYLLYFYAILTYRKVTPFFKGPRKL